LKHLFFGGLIILFASLCVPAVSQNASEEVIWHNDYELARTIAAAENKPLLVSFRCVP